MDVGLPMHRPGTENAASGRNQAAPVILAIDPGTTQSGWVLFDGARVLQSGVSPNASVLMAAYSHAAGRANCAAIEQIVGMGQRAGTETFESARWAGRFEEAWSRGGPGRVLLLPRRAVKAHLRDSTGTMPKGDAEVRGQLIALLGEPGRKAAPGPTYGVASHAWAALAVAFAAHRQLSSAAHGNPADAGRARLQTPAATTNAVARGDESARATSESVAV